MIIALFRKEIREALWKIILGAVVMIFLALSLPYLFEIIQGFVSQIPPEQMGWIQQLVPVNILQNYSLYIWSQWNGKNLYQVGTILAVLFGMSLVAGETGGHTISFLLARPIARKQVYTTKIAAGALSLIFIIGVSTFALLLSAIRFAPEPVESGVIIMATLITALGLLLVFSLAMFFSTIVDDSVKAGGITALVLLISSIMGWLPLTRKLSLFTHITGAQYVLQGTFPVVPVFVMAVLTVGLWVAGATFFDKKQF